MNDSSSFIIRCPNCNAANRIPADRIGKAAKCGKCHAELPTDQKAAEPEASYKMRCTACGAKNRVPGEKLNAGAKCGKCGAKLKTEELFTPQPIMVTDGNFDTMVLKSPLPVLMWAWAPWWPTCGALAPIIDQFGVESKGKVRVGKLNVDTSPMLASKFSILSVPFIFIFDNGQIKESGPGGLQKHELMMRMAPYI
jgi:thiol-disulfide isomerase/thioredoxin